jgi:hypothetical protein
MTSQDVRETETTGGRCRDSGINGKQAEANSAYVERMDTLFDKPYRHPFLHWGAFVLSVISLVILVTWVSGPRVEVGLGWFWLDLCISVLFAFEFFTRSGFHWGAYGYIASHFFDFVAIAPALVLVYFNVPFQGTWLWIILVARIVRVLDRILGDGFVSRNVLALAEGFEEEITDRVLLRIITRIRTDVGRCGLAGGLSDVLKRNRESVLQRVQAQHPREGLIANVSQWVGLDEALKKAEERTYDAVVEVVGSEEVDRTIRESIDSAFSTLQSELGVRSWRQNLGFGRKRRPAGSTRKIAKIAENKPGK